MAPLNSTWNSREHWYFMISYSHSKGFHTIMVVLDWFNTLAHFIPTMDILSQRLSNICWLKLHGRIHSASKPTAVPPLGHLSVSFPQTLHWIKMGMSQVSSFKLVASTSTTSLLWQQMPSITLNPSAFLNSSANSVSTAMKSNSSAKFISVYKQKFLSISCISGTHSPKQRAWSVYGGLHSGTLPLHRNGILNVLKKCTYLHAKC